MNVLEPYCIKDYIYHFSDDFYLIKKNNTIYSYDYHHNLIGQTKKIRGIIGTMISKEGHVVFTVSDRKYIYIWDIKNQSLNKINFTKSINPSVEKIFDDDKKIYIYCGVDNKLIYVDKTTFEIDTVEYNAIESIHPKEVFLYKNDMYYIKRVIDKNGLCGYELLKKENGFFKKKLKIKNDFLFETEFRVMDNGRYCLISNAKINSRGIIYIIDLEDNKKYDEIHFYHISFYRIIAEFLVVNNEVYIVYQANPIKCCFGEKETWHTYIYSISERKVIHEVSYSLAIKYIANKNMIIIESNYPRKASKFYTFLDKNININDIINLIQE